MCLSVPLQLAQVPLVEIHPNLNIVFALDLAAVLNSSRTIKPGPALRKTESA